LADATASNLKICRYHAAGTYSLQTAPLANQNFLVIRAGDGTTAFTCPALPPSPIPVPSPLFTLPHQPVI
jgi:hypothetical protein